MADIKGLDKARVLKTLYSDSDGGEMSAIKLITDAVSKSLAFSAMTEPGERNGPFPAFLL